jgi:hypothetical protein
MLRCRFARRLLGILIYGGILGRADPHATCFVYLFHACAADSLLYFCSPPSFLWSPLDVCGDADRATNTTTRSPDASRASNPAQNRRISTETWWPSQTLATEAPELGPRRPSTRRPWYSLARRRHQRQRTPTTITLLPCLGCCRSCRHRRRKATSKSRLVSRPSSWTPQSTRWATTRLPIYRCRGLPGR